MQPSDQPGPGYKLLSSILNFFFKLLYHQFAWTYDWVADLVSIGRWKSWIYVVLPYLDRVEVLELGCGPGHLQRAVMSQDGYIAGIDLSPQMLRIANKRIIDDQRAGRLVLAEAQHLPFRHKSFQKVVSTFPNNYINDPDTLGQVWRVLETPGELIILPTARITGTNALDRLASWLFRITGQAPPLENTGLERSFSLPHTRLAEAGFRTHHHLVELPGSEVLLVHAYKDQPTG